MIKRILLLLGISSAAWAWWTRPGAGGWSTGSVQSGRIDPPSNLQSLADAYWSFLRRTTLGLVRPQIDKGGVDLCLLGLFSLIRLGGPTLAEDTISWPVQGGLLVAQPGGYFALAKAGNRGRVEVSGLRPRLPRCLYYLIQQPLHCWLGNGFLRQL